MVKFYQSIKNTVKVKGLVHGNGPLCNDGWIMYEILVFRPLFEASEKTISIHNDVALDTYRIVTKNDILKNGDIVEIKGYFCEVMNLFNEDFYICPVCGKKTKEIQTKFSIVKADKINVLCSDNSKYMEHYYFLESEARNGQWHNFIIASDIFIEGVVLNRWDDESAIGDVTVYKVKNQLNNFLYELFHKGLDEFQGKRFIYDKTIEHYLWNLEDRQGIIHRATGNIAMLQNSDDWFQCISCHSSIVIENKKPILILDKQPILEEAL